MTFVPTLNFNGKCREAMELYQKAFDGKVTVLMTYGEANDTSFSFKEEQENWFYSFVITKVPAAIIMNAMQKVTPGNSL